MGKVQLFLNRLTSLVDEHHVLGSLANAAEHIVHLQTQLLSATVRGWFILINWWRGNFENLVGCVSDELVWIDEVVEVHEHLAKDNKSTLESTYFSKQVKVGVNTTLCVQDCPVEHNLILIDLHLRWSDRREGVTLAVDKGLEWVLENSQAPHFVLQLYFVLLED